MKINGEDLSILKEKKSRKTLLKIVIAFLLIIIIFTLYEFFFIFKIKSNYDFNQEILNNGQKYEKSVYIKYKDKIYACVYGESYQLDDVDIGSFKVLDSMDYSDSYVAVDKNNVYFGNISISDLKPNKLYTVGNNYYSDGINSYFCLNTFEKNKDLSNKSKIRQYIEYYFFKGEKPQEYSYPFKKVEATKTLKAIKDLRYLASDGEKVYYKGEVLENADLNTLKAVDRYNEYFADKENVYYKSKLLTLPSNDKLKVVSVEQAERNYLFDGLNGNVFLEEYAFDKKYVPYQVLGVNSSHIKDLLFVSKDGIFFYNSEIKDNRTLEKLLDIKYISTDEIREFVRDKKLIAFKGEEVTTASIKYKESHVAEIFLAVFLTTFFGISILMISLKWKAQKKDREKLEEERKKIEKQMEFWDNYYNNNEDEKKEDEKIPTSYKSYDDEEEIKKEIDKIKPIVKNSDDIEGLKKREKKINSVIKNFNFDELDEEEK